MFILAIFLTAGFLHSQEQILISYQRNFSRAALSSKADILLDAKNDDRAGEFIGDLYIFALRYILENGELLGGDPDMVNLAAIAARGVWATGHPAAAPLLWNIFLVFNDSHTKVEILSSLKKFERERRAITGSLNKYLTDKSSAYLSGEPADFAVLMMVIEMLVSYNDVASYPALFTAAAVFPQPLSTESRRALEEIPGNLRDFLMGKLMNGLATEKLTAYTILAERPDISASEKTDLAELALEIVLALPAQDSSSILLRCAAVEALTQAKRTRASHLAIKHFRLIQNEYLSGVVPEERFTEAINCLANMGDFESAQTLILELGHINGVVEKGGAYEEDILIALIKKLGEMENKAAFDFLLYVDYLGYPDNIKAAAREALNRLRW